MKVLFSNFYHEHFFWGGKIGRAWQARSDRILRIAQSLFARLSPLIPNDPRNRRHYAPRGFIDTVVAIEGKVVGLHTLGKQHDLFLNREILQVHRVIRRELLDVGERIQLPVLGLEEKPIYVEYTKNNKAIIQQHAAASCTAAATAMLMMDHGKECGLGQLRQRSGGTTPDMVADIEAVSLHAKVTQAPDDVNELKALLEENGSAIITIRWEGGGHVIILDAIDDHVARIRDPWHGWEITITVEALKARYGHAKSDIIQITG